VPRRKMEEVVDGIYLEPVPITLGDEVKIKYYGSLSGSDEARLYLHTGFGYDNWYGIRDLPMSKTRDGGWKASLRITDNSCLNFCFHDSGMHWDNNNGRDWTYEIHEGDLIGH